MFNQESDYSKNINYEELLNKILTNLPLIFLCAYKMGRCTMEDVINITGKHEFALYKKNGKWEVSVNNIHQDMKNALEESRDFYLTLFDEFPAYIWRAGLDAKCNYFNKNWLLFTGRTLEQEVGDGWAQGVHADDLDECFQTYIKSFEKREAFDMVYRLKRHDGEYRWILVREYQRTQLKTSLKVLHRSEMLSLKSRRARD